MSGEEGSYTSNDPYARTDYQRAFDANVLKPFADVLAYDGAIDNMPESLISDTAKSDMAISDDKTYFERRRMMTEAIVAQLNTEKNNALFKPLYQTGIFAGVEIVSTAATLKVIPKDSLGGSLGIVEAIRTGTLILKDVIKTAYTWWAPGNDPLARWELQFAERMPYIPHELWPKIVDTFGSARMGMNMLNYKSVTEFFDVAFNLPSVNRHPYTPPLTVEDIPSISEKINVFLDTFFEDYENAESAKLAIQAGVRKYLRKLASNSPGCVCIHLLGAPGVGKTYFMQKFAKKLQEALDDHVIVSDVPIRGLDAKELEGGRDDSGHMMPGNLLTALSQIGKQGTPFGILLFDEASWLNGELKQSAKKIFEPTLGQFQSQFLDGNEVSLKGFLVIMASNDVIENQALRSRFINVEFPAFRKERLKEKAFENLPHYLIGTELLLEDVKNDEKILKIFESATNMRDIDHQLPEAIERILTRNDHRAD